MRPSAWDPRPRRRRVGRYLKYRRAFSGVVATIPSDSTPAAVSLAWVAPHLGDRAPAEGAPEADEQGEEEGAAAPIVGQRDGLLAVDGGQREVGSSSRRVRPADGIQPWSSLTPPARLFSRETAAPSERRARRPRARRPAALWPVAPRPARSPASSGQRGQAVIARERKAVTRSARPAPASSYIATRLLVLSVALMDLTQDNQGDRQ